MPPDGLSQFLTCDVWLKSYTQDLTLLGVLFTINAGLSVVDSIMAQMTESLRESIRNEIKKFVDEDWLRAIAPGDDESDKVIRTTLQPLVDDVVQTKEEIQFLFKTNAKVWKRIMMAVAAIVLFCMAIPYTARIMLLSALTLPLMLLSFKIEKKCFVSKFEKSAKNVRETFAKLKKGSTTKETDSKAIAEKLSGPEGAIAAGARTP